MIYLRLGGLAVFLGVVGLALWYRGEAISATAAAMQAKADLATAIDANKAQQQAIAELEHQLKVNDQIVAGLASRLASIRTELLADREEVADLKDRDNDVRTYLNSPVPDALRSVLDKRTQRAGDHQDGKTAPAVGSREALP
ncbi:hypothetical protein [Aminobacter niigataensis]|uniref:hypothetical protein n=1 Tax=Aminobacter niigataensis TaxID=83265 RepID=UPI0024CCFE1C|nr:hypothetical protein [Aminobacter niigataensis]CAI2936172.1 protein of unknown function [Aminobacter niigataensis]